MGAEEQVVETIVNIFLKLSLAGTEIGIKVAGAGCKAIGLSFYALAKSIKRKTEQGKQLTAGEVAFTNLLKSGEEIHSVWLNKDDLVNFTQIATQLGVSFVAIKNGDEIIKGRKFLSNENTEAVEFPEDFKNMVSISYRASDEVRMAHILEMFDTVNASRAEIDKEATKTELDETVDDVEQFIKENEVEVELPPEVVASNEMEVKEQVSEIDSTATVTEARQTNSGNESPLCFNQFGFAGTPNKEEFEKAYIYYVDAHNINTNEPNYLTALYEQGLKLIEKSEKDVNKQIDTNEKSIKIDSPNKSTTKQAEVKTDVAECYKFFGFNNEPTVQELKAAYVSFVEKYGSVPGSNIVDNMYNAAIDLLDKPNKDILKFCYEFFGFNKTPTRVELEQAYKNYDVFSTDGAKFANQIYEQALTAMEKSESIRTTLEAKRERNSLNNSDKENYIDKIIAETQKPTERQEL